ncbi:ZinT/AdcA family metal-binding protein [Ornithinibacillus sp. L9]|uniref:ZinT/AdcA family metal-binding protein n=1 Tax=Ornithinibacillus caprae TaxID=2678566 RepID=A0A6N8FG08_9BACI|nr:metal-binding protein ZinT [Ornithinibacillus caprae]MUK88500.1 ZinT/AdcA family metal-binding protein [Ornithinibacillus caprae]
MKYFLGIWLSVLGLSLFLVGCQDASSSENESVEGTSAESEEQEAEISVTIEGLADHYHTSGPILLTAKTNEEIDHPHWHWYTLQPGEKEWETVPDQETESYEGVADTDGIQIKAVLYGDDHEVIAESDPVTITIDDHGHGHAQDEELQQIYDGYFEDSQIEGRALSDWEGDWQSVYPYLQDGTLDKVFEYKEEHDGDKTAEEYKEYYEIGYQTDVDRIVIEGDMVTFYENDEVYSGEFVYDGYEILEYEAGNRGVRFIFKHDGEEEGVPTYIQFSDHSIFPTDAHHFHLYWGDDRQALLDEVVNWPTYYPSELDADGIVSDMIAH